MNNNPYISKQGMTLVELLIVLALLAGLATFALTSMDDLSARSRYDVTVERMKRVDTLLRGDGVNPGRFVADMGRLPTNLCELWNSSMDFGTVSYTNSVGGTAITGQLFCGWNGPYLSASGTNYYDGFGDDFEYTNKPNPYLATTNLGRHSDWLDRNLSNSYASVTQCTLQVQVMAVNTDVSVSPFWDAMANTNQAPNYNSTTPYNCGDAVLANSNMFRCIISCVNSNPCLENPLANWIFIDRHSYPTHAEVVLVLPRVDSSPAYVFTNGNLVANGNPCVLEHLMPGTRSIYAYAYNIGECGSGTVQTNMWWSGLQTVEIHPGMNFIKLYLSRRIPSP